MVLWNLTCIIAGQRIRHSRVQCRLLAGKDEHGDTSNSARPIPMGAVGLRVCPRDTVTCDRMTVIFARCKDPDPSGPLTP